MPVLHCDVDAAKEQLKAAGATIDAGNTEHERWRATYGDAIAVAYDDKIVIQGSEPRDIESIIADTEDRAYLYFDGASRGNPGPAAIGWVLVSSNGIVAEAGDTIGEATNNQAEYRALIAGLDAATDLGFSELHVRGDSELIVKQLKGEYDTNDPVLREHRVTAIELLSSIPSWTVKHVPRGVNERADDLANEALDRI